MNNLLKHKYSDSIFNKKILIIGPYPPPLGGIAIHIKRVTQKFKSQKNNVEIWNTSRHFSSTFTKTCNLIKTIHKLKPDIIYNHEPTFSRLTLATIILLKYVYRYKVTLIDHDCRTLYSYSPHNKTVFRGLAKKANATVVIGDTTHQCYTDNQIPKTKYYSIESPFLPPNLEEEKNILSRYPQSLHDFIKAHTPIISANAFAPILVNGKDLYGFDTSTKLIKKLIQNHPEIGLIWGIAQKEKYPYFSKIQERVEKLGLKNHFYFLTSTEEFWPLIKQSDIFIRPTLSDSFGISVQEATLLKTPTIASNVCIRPKGSMLFEPENINLFIEKTNVMLQSKEKAICDLKIKQL